MPKSLKDQIGFFVTIPESLVERAAEIGTDALCLFVYLRYRTNRERGVAWPNYARMSVDLGWGRSRISAAIKALEAAGALERQKRFGRSVIYTLKFTPQDVAVPEAATASSPDSGLLDDPQSSRSETAVVPIQDSSSPDSGLHTLDRVNPRPSGTETEELINALQKRKVKPEIAAGLVQNYTAERIHECLKAGAKGGLLVNAIMGRARLPTVDGQHDPQDAFWRDRQ